MRAFIKVLKNAAKNKTIFSTADLEELAEDNGIVVEIFSRFIARLNDEGILLKRGRDKYEFVQD